jgi:outer membrane protein assembly factor BamB
MRLFQASMMPMMLYCILAGGSSALAEWGTTQGDAAHDGYVPMTVTSAAPKLLWSTPGMLVQSNLAVGGGDVFFETKQPDKNMADSLYALNEQTGAVVWKKSPALYTGDPAYSNGTVYLQLSDQNAIVGWNVQTQAQVFSASYPSQDDATLAPVVVNNTLYSGGGDAGEAYAYNTATSASLWATTVPHSGSYGGESPAVDANYVYFIGGLGSDLIIANKATGALVSETGPHAESFAGSPLLTGKGGLFYVQNGTGEYLDITNPASPKVIWTMDNLSSGDAPAYANGILYVSSGWPDLTDTLYAIDPLTGQVKWSLAGATGFDNMIVTDNVLFTVEGSNTVAISLATHQVLWSVPITGTMAVSDNELFIGSAGVVSAYLIAVPEPSSLLLLATSAAALLFPNRRKRTRNDGICDIQPF